MNIYIIIKSFIYIRIVFVVNAYEIKIILFRKMKLQLVIKQLS
jgi:hypothetical protein